MNEIVHKTDEILTKRPISSTLDKMEIGQVEVFPISQMVTVRNQITQKRLLDRSLKFETSTHPEEGTINVVKIA